MRGDRAEVGRVKRGALISAERASVLELAVFRCSCREIQRWTGWCARRLSPPDLGTFSRLGREEPATDLTRGPSASAAASLGRVEQLSIRRCGRVRASRVERLALPRCPAGTGPSSAITGRPFGSGPAPSRAARAPLRRKARAQRIGTAPDIGVRDVPYHLAVGTDTDEELPRAVGERASVHASPA